jgi:hypothetical protein
MNDMITEGSSEMCRCRDSVGDRLFCELAHHVADDV